MSDERLLKELAQLERARAAAGPEPVWDALAGGNLTAEQLARLQAEARTTPEAAAAWEAFQPLDAPFRAALTARLAQELRAGAPTQPSAAPAPAGRVWNSVPGWLRLGLAPALVLAVLLVSVRIWRDPGPLPAYELRLSGDSRSLRSTTTAAEVGSATPASFAPGNRFELVLTPATSAGRAVEARLFIVRGARLETLAAPAPTLSVDGAWRLAGVVGQDVQLPLGEFTLLVVVGRPGDLPDPAQLAARSSTTTPLRGPRWSAWQVRARGVPGP